MTYLLAFWQAAQYFIPDDFQSWAVGVLCGFITASYLGLFQFIVERQTEGVTTIR